MWDTVETSFGEQAEDCVAGGSGSSAGGRSEWGTEEGSSGCAAGVHFPDLYSACSESCSRPSAELNSEKHAEAGHSGEEELCGEMSAVDCSVDAGCFEGGLVERGTWNYCSFH